MGAHTDPDSARSNLQLALALAVLVGIVVAGWAALMVMLILLMAR
jgi:hypothetical protein